MGQFFVECIGRVVTTIACLSVGWFLGIVIAAAFCPEVFQQ